MGETALVAQQREAAIRRLLEPYGGSMAALGDALRCVLAAHGCVSVGDATEPDAWVFGPFKLLLCVADAPNWCACCGMDPVATITITHDTRAASSMQIADEADLRDTWDQFWNDVYSVERTSPTNMCLPQCDVSGDAIEGTCATEWHVPPPLD